MRAAAGTMASERRSFSLQDVAGSGGAHAGRASAMPKIATMNMNVRSRPGSTPAMYSAPIDSSASTP